MTLTAELIRGGLLDLAHFDVTSFGSMKRAKPSLMRLRTAVRSD